MITNTYEELKIDPVFKRLVQPLGEDVLKVLRRDLLHDTSPRTIQTWNGFVLHEFEKYELCESYKLPIQTIEKSFANRDHVCSYLCTRQLTRSDLTGEYKKYLIGELFYFEEQRLLKENPERTNAKYRLAYKIGDQVSIAGGTVLKYSTYAAAMNTIFEQSPALALRILMGQTRVSHENVIELSRLTAEELKKVAESALKENMQRLTFSDIRMEANYTHIRHKATVSRRERREQRVKKAHAAIHQMPVYDPDAEVNSLCMTITSWMSSIDRVNRSTNFSSISDKAMFELMKQLTALDGSINTIQKSLIERTPQ